MMSQKEEGKKQAHERLMMKRNSRWDFLHQRVNKKIYLIKTEFVLKSMISYAFTLRRLNQTSFFQSLQSHYCFWNLEYIFVQTPFSRSIISQSSFFLSDCSIASRSAKSFKGSAKSEAYPIVLSLFSLKTIYAFICCHCVLSFSRSNCISLTILSSLLPMLSCYT